MFIKTVKTLLKSNSTAHTGKPYKISLEPNLQSHKSRSGKMAFYKIE